MHGLGFTGYHRFVNIALTGYNDPVIRDGIPAFNDEQIAGLDRVGINDPDCSAACAGFGTFAGFRSGICFAAAGDGNCGAVCGGAAGAGIRHFLFLCCAFGALNYCADIRPAPYAAVNI